MIRSLVAVALVAAVPMAARVHGAGGGGGEPRAGSLRVVIGFRGKPDAAFVERHGGTVELEVRSARALAATLPLAAVERLQMDADVAYVEADGEVRAFGKRAPVQPDEATPSGISQVKADQAWGVTKGGGVNVAIVDTGIDDAHPDLAGHVVLGANFVNANPPRDDNGHGTHVSGTVGAIDNAIGVVGVAPDIRLYAVKVLDRRGSGYNTSVAAGIDWAAANGMHVVNMSLGGYYSSVMAAAIANAQAKGVVLIAAAGNLGNAAPGSATTLYPATDENVIAVSAVDGSGRIASFSSTGPKVELAAPGVGVLSTYKGGGYLVASGTSMAAPHVSGAAALVIARGVTDVNGNGRINDEVRAILDATAVDLGSPGRDDLYGHGIVNAAAAVR